MNKIYLYPASVPHLPFLARFESAIAAALTTPESALDKFATKKGMAPASLAYI